ncbi:membrane protein [Bacilli bacterium]|nr:membrane protein [Bacilli bacterium]
MKNRIEEEKIISSSINGKKGKLHKGYLILSVLLGMILAIGMPFFNEPDGQFHYVVSSNMVNLSNDISAYGEVSIGTGIDQQLEVYQQGGYFQKYYLTRIVEMPMSKQPRQGLTENPNIKSYNFLGHLIPALGVWIGHKIYPSMGMMITTARLFSVLINSLLMFLIIKSVKKGKMIFVALSLTPVTLNSFASLSYDSLSFVLVAWLIAIVINSLVDQQIKWWRWLELAVASVAIYFGAKTNFKVLLLFIPVLIAMFVFPKLYQKLSRFFSDLWTNKKALVLSLLVGLGLIFVILIVLLGLRHNGIFYSIYRFIINYVVNLRDYLSVSSVFYNLLGSPYPNINYTPAWVSMIWYIVLFAVLLSEDKFIKSKFISLTSMVIFLMGIAAVYYVYMTYTPTGAPVGNPTILGQMQGLQGRYFTPTLFLLLFVTCYEKFKIKINGQKGILLFVMGIAVITNVLLLFSTLFGAYYL